MCLGACACVCKHVSSVLFIWHFFLLFVEKTVSLASSTSPYNCSLVHICHDTSIGLHPLLQTTACSPNGGVALFFLSISYNQPLFLIAQSGDAISGKETVMFSDSQWLWSKSALESSKCHTHPSTPSECNLSSPSSPLFLLCEKQRANCVTRVGVGDTHDSLSCATFI